ncbi:MAG: hypothetical protein J5809_09465, partial [Selenomonadaceae bacterium]|nr:hypothetical protein [Selenomonadaceae bacterium]
LSFGAKESSKENMPASLASMRAGGRGAPSMARFKFAFRVRFKFAFMARLKILVYGRFKFAFFS